MTDPDRECWGEGAQPARLWAGSDIGDGWGDGDDLGKGNGSGSGLGNDGWSDGNGASPPEVNT